MWIATRRWRSRRPLASRISTTRRRTTWPPKPKCSFTRLTSASDGLAGMAQQQVGALVSPASGPVTTVSTVDPIKVYFTASEQEYLDFNRRFPTQASRDAETGRLPLELILA